MNILNQNTTDCQVEFESNFHCKNLGPKTTLDYALRYLNEGFSILPLRPFSKKPRLSVWKRYQLRRPTENELRAWFQNDAYGVAVVCGNISNLIIIDADGEEWQAIANEFLKAFPSLQTTRMVSTGSGKLHILIRCKNIPENLTKKVRPFPGGKIELRSKGHYCVAPPSTHPCGKPYRFINPNAPIVEVNRSELDSIINWFRTSNCNGGETGREKDRDIRLNSRENNNSFCGESDLDRPVQILLSESVRKGTEGQRNTVGLELARSLHTFGVTWPMAVFIMRRYVQLVPQPPEASHRYTFHEAKLTLLNVWGGDAGDFLHPENCTCSVCQKADRLFINPDGQDSNLGTVKIPVFGPKGALSAHFLIDFDLLRSKPTTNIPHTCRHWANRGNPDKYPHRAKVPKVERGKDGEIGMSFGKVYTCTGCVPYLRKLDMKKVRRFYPNGFWFQVFQYEDFFYESVHKDFERAGSMPFGIVNFTDKLFIMLSDVNVRENMSFVSWQDPLCEALLTSFLSYDPQKPLNRKKVRPPRDVEGRVEMEKSNNGSMKKESDFYNFTIIGTTEEIYRALEKMGCEVNWQTGHVHYSDEALQFFWRIAKAREGKGKRCKVIPIFDMENPLQTAF